MSCPDLLNPGKSLKEEGDPWVLDLNFSEDPTAFPLPLSFPKRRNVESRPAPHTSLLWVWSSGLESGFLERLKVLLAQMPLGQEFVLNFFVNFCCSPPPHPSSGKAHAAEVVAIPSFP